MELNLQHELAVLQRTATADLKAKFTELSGDDTRTRNRTWLIRRIAWLLQAKVSGGLSERARQRASELANDADLRTAAPRTVVKTLPIQQQTITAPLPFAADKRLPLPGSLITRQYKGQTLKVLVLPQGFEFEGVVYKSLTAVAKHITGSHCNGFQFFRLDQEAQS